MTKFVPGTNIPVDRLGQGGFSGTTGKEYRDLQRLTNPRKRGKGKLPAAQEPGPLKGGIVRAYPSADGSSSGGIASPLTETDYAAREYHSAELLVSSDGFFVIEIEPIKSVTMVDANGAEAVLNYKVPL